MERHLFRSLLGTLSLVPVVHLILALGPGVGFFLPEAVPVPPDLDSHFRYLSGVFLALPLIAWWTLRDIDGRVMPLRLIGLAVLAGGLLRLLSMAQYGPPDQIGMRLGLVLELIVVPLTIVWHARLARQSSAAAR